MTTARGMMVPVTIRSLSRPPFFRPAYYEMKKTKHPSLLSPQQQSVLSRLLPVARLATSGRLGNLPIRPRTHTLIIGPSGYGKSHIARALGAQLSLPTLVINVSSWVVLSARNEPWTFSTIAEWLDQIPRGGVLVLDEIDKLGGVGSPSGAGEWNSHIQLECHDLLDGVIPLATKIPERSEECWETSPIISMQEELSTRLQERVFIVGCGAWQHAWRGNSRKLGFLPGDSDSDLPNQEQILNSLEPELRQRFRHDVCWLSPMTHADYLFVSSQIASKIFEPAARKAWNRLAPAAIERAITAGLGMRIFEELMLSVLLDSESRDVNKFRPNDLWI